MSAVTLIHGDCREIAPTLDYTAVISDPPYGMAWNTNTNRFTGGEGRPPGGRGTFGKAVEGDRAPFDPSPWLDRSKVVLFGSNHFAQRLPVGTTLVWMKRKPTAYGAFLSDAELAWMKGGHGVYAHMDLSINGKGGNFPNYHPTLKPVGLMRWALAKARVTPADVVLDPYCGSGTTLLACMDLGIPCIGIEIDAEHFATAERRVAEHRVQSDMFAGEVA